MFEKCFTPPIGLLAAACAVALATAAIATAPIAQAQIFSMCVATVDGKIQLSDVEGFPESYRDAARIIAESYADTDTPPESFYVEVDEVDETLVFHLWHESAFTPENCNLAGNPGGLCRDVHFDPETNQVTAVYFWQ